MRETKAKKKTDDAGGDSQHSFYWEALENFRSLHRRQNLHALLEQKLKEPAIEDVVNRSTILCEDYIYNRLRSVEMIENSDGVKVPVQEQWGNRVPTAVSLEVQKLGAMMEGKYPELYVNVSRQIMMPLRSDVAVRKAMVSIGDCMFKYSIVTWGRIIGLFAVAGAIAIECMEQGNSRHIQTIVTIFSELIQRHAAQWISKQGGWIKIMTAFCSPEEVQGMRAMVAAGAIFGFLFSWTYFS